MRLQVNEFYSVCIDQIKLCVCVIRLLLIPLIPVEMIVFLKVATERLCEYQYEVSDSQF